MSLEENPVDIVVTTDALVRIAWFTGMFVLIAVLEAILPRRQRKQSVARRWTNNLGISLGNQLVLRGLLPISAIGMAALAAQHQWGLLNITPIPFWLAVMGSLLVLDLVIYLQHRAFHAVPFLWRLHRMHHTDTEFDVTTGVRFHPVSVFFSALIKLATVGLLGAPVFAVLVFEILLNATSLFNHSNLRLAPRFDQLLRLIMVTPDMHRVHHSSNPLEHNQNFGFNLPWWDRLFDTYHEQPGRGHSGMQIGLTSFRSAPDQRLGQLLLQPFK